MDDMTQSMPAFEQTLARHGLRIARTPIAILQINVGKRCNQACHHCHVEAGPKRTEIMGQRTVDRLIELLDQSATIHTVDITGGAPELNPHFRTLVAASRQRQKHVIDRCNLTVFFETGQEDLPDFLKAHRVKVVASLPCYSKANVDKQRGNGVFDKSIRALQRLNALGYGQENPELPLDLVYNPLGAFLPPPQDTLEHRYKEALHARFGIHFNRLSTITNMPIKRFLDQLRREQSYEEYMSMLVNQFNVDTAEHVMCRDLLSIGWDGSLYDCDFNQMLEIPLGKTKTTIWDIDSFDQLMRPIAFANHCYGCTAGAGSSCGGTLV